MSIKPSAATEIRALIDALAGADAIKREAAIARLAVIGPRSIDRLLTLFDTPATTDSTRLAILKVFESIGDPRTVPVVRRALASPAPIPLAAVAVLRRLLGTTSDQGATESLDALVALVTDVSADRSLRLAAYDALGDAPADVQVRVRSALQQDVDPVVRGRAQDPGDDRATSAIEWREALAGRTGNDPARLLDAARHHAHTAPLGELRRLIDEARAREAPLNEPVLVQQWRELRGQVHQTLALRGSSVALYDLRETFEAAEGSLPASFVGAVQAIGDASSLEAIAAAYERSADERWRGQLKDAFDAIAARLKLPARHPVMKRIASRWPQAAAVFSTPSRTTPRRSTRPRT